MAEPENDPGVRLDAAALHRVADRFAADGQTLEAAARRHRAGLSFDGSRAGRMHTVHGDALHTALDRLGEDLARWGRAVDEIAATLRAGAGRYADADRRCAARIG